MYIYWEERQRERDYVDERLAPSSPSLSYFVSNLIIFPFITHVFFLIVKLLFTFS